MGGLTSHSPPCPQSGVETPRGLPWSDSGGRNCSKGNFYPPETWEGVPRRYWFFSGEGCLYLFIFIFFWKKQARDSWCGSHSPEGRRVRERGRPPRFGSGAGGSRWLRIPEFPPQLRRPGNVRPVSGAGAGPAGGRSIVPPPPGLWLLPARKLSPSPHFFQMVLVGKVWEREA